ncbi:MAG: hypothetical protein M3N13_09795 [Candidatus Eremiobacteraeota bacterium]|nr:hypothetical protein [Candidatus Eremiobacteraeota bacterium]
MPRRLGLATLVTTWYARAMRARFEFTFHLIAANAVEGHGDAALGLLGSSGWELRGISPAAQGGYIVALQRPLDEDAPLPGAMALAATLEEPLAMPSPAELEER